MTLRNRCPVRPHRRVARPPQAHTVHRQSLLCLGGRRCEAWGRQPCPGAWCLLQPRPAMAPHSAACSDASQGGLMTRGLSRGLFPGLTLWPSGLRPFKSHVLLCARCLFRVRVILRGHVAVCPVSSLLGTQSSGRSLCSLEEWHCCSLWMWARHHPPVATRWSPCNLSPVVGICGQRGLSRGPTVTALAPPTWQSVAVVLSSGLGPRMS